MSTVKTTSITHGSNSGTANLGLTSDGKVGIGIASPLGQFAVSDGTRTAEINPHSNGTYIGNRTDHNLLFQINAAEKGRIDTGGYLLWACTSQDGNASTGVRLSNLGAVFATRDAEYAGIFRRSSSDGGVILFRRDSSNVGSISVTSSNTAFNTSSDYRLKENVTALTGAITRIKTLKPYRFNFKVDASKTVDGFLAHEVTTVPEAITGTKDAVATEDSEAAKKGDPIYQQIDQSKLVPLLTAALQEAIAKIETLETKVAALESE
jgi:hypothetical protein